MRIALGVEYNGAPFRGWQIQDSVATVQGALQAALSKVADQKIKIVCAGRTDSGVHATHQVIHFDTEMIRSESAWVMGTNHYLPSTINIQWATDISTDFHARFSALSRRYHYFIYNHHVRSSLLEQLTTWVDHPLSEKLMQEAAQTFLGEHDFTSFRGAHCQSKTPFRHVFAINVSRSAALLKIDIVANSFLHHMVRNIVGVLIEIGKEKKPVGWAKEVLLTKNRSAAARTASPEGLYLTGVTYGDVFNLPTHFRQLPLFKDL